MACGGCRKAAEANYKMMASGAMKAAGRAIRAYINGRPVFSATQMVMERVKICQNCPSDKYMEHEEKCPKGHW